MASVMELRRDLHRCIDNLPEHKLSVLLPLAEVLSGDEYPKEPEETDPFYCDANRKWLKESIRQAEAGQLTEHELIEI